MIKEIECKTQEELEKCCKDGNIAVVRTGLFTACGSSQVMAYDSSQVTAYGSSQVRAYGSSQVMAYGYVAITSHSDTAKISKGKHCRLTKVPPVKDIEDYCERYPVKESTDSVFLYKAVSIVVSPDCDGKIRTDMAEIVEVIEDWQSYQWK